MLIHPTDTVCVVPHNDTPVGRFWPPATPDDRQLINGKNIPAMVFSEAQADGSPRLLLVRQRAIDDCRWDRDAAREVADRREREISE